MTPKQYLNGYISLNKEIDSMCKELYRLRRLAESTGGKPLDAVGRGCRADPSAIYTEVVHKIIDMENRINDKIDELILKRDEIEKVIMSVDDINLRTLLRHKYINGHGFERIAVEMNYCKRQVIRLHGTALIAIKMSPNVTL